MGQRISYYKNNFNIGFKDLIFENFSKFKTWYLDKDKFSMEQFNEPFGEDSLRYYFKKESDLKTDFDKLSKFFINELIAEFVGTYFDSTHQNNDVLEYFGPMFNKWRYNESTELVYETKDKKFIELWKYLIFGRSLKDNLYYESLYIELNIGFLNRQEYLLLKSKIEMYFGNHTTMRNKFWTNEEKEKYEKALSDNTFILTEHNPKTSGLQYVLYAINELTDQNKDLITGIE